MSGTRGVNTATHARILIVEDEGIIACHIAQHLAAAGYDLAGIAESSEEVLAMIPQSHPDLILMDIHIKGEKDGIETAIVLRERFDLPIIYLTAHTDQAIIERARRTGAAGFLTKPIHHVSLGITIQMALHKYESDRAARHQRALMSTALASMADAMAVVNRDGRIEFLNKPAEELTGWTNEAACGQSVGLILPLIEVASRRTANEILSPAPGQPLPRRFPLNVAVTTRLGTQFRVEGEIAPSIEGSSMVGMVVTFRDATVRQAQEDILRQESKMHAVGRLAAGIAHDFNNLLVVILGYADALCSSPLDPSSLRAANAILKAGEDAASFTRQLLRFSRKETVDREALDVNELIAESEDLLRRLAGPSVHILFRFDEAPATIWADRGQLKQVLINLVANARDAMPAGGKVTIETACLNASLEAGGGIANASITDKGITSKEVVAITVTDNGTGMTAETAEHLFEPFFTTKPLGKGTGLGLSIVYSIVTDLGGAIHAASQPGNGATFTIHIPRWRHNNGNGNDCS